MKIVTLPVGQMKANCYLLIDEITNKALIIDPGDEGDFIIRRLRDEQVKPELIIATHGHFDHIMAALELKLAFSIPFLIHRNDQPILDRHQQTAKYFLGVEVDPPPPVDSYIKHGDIITFGQENLKVIATPGHTQGSICLYHKNGYLFSGDTIFAGGGVGRTDLKGGNQKQILNSIKTKIFTLPGNTIIYPGHGEETTVAMEKTLHQETFI